MAIIIWERVEPKTLWKNGENLAIRIFSFTHNVLNISRGTYNNQPFPNQAVVFTYLHNKYFENTLEKG